MKYRKLGKTEFKVSEISLGTWQVGGKWGNQFDEANALAILNEAVDQGVNFIDTADVYSNGLSERTVGKFVKARSERLYVATKCGRKLNPHNNESYTPQAMRKFVEDSLTNSGLETLDIVQLHCPPYQVYYRPEIFEEFDKLKSEGKILNLGVSVEKVEEAMKAIEYPNVATVQIIYNIFRQRPDEKFFEEAHNQDVGIIVRVPLASGLLTGQYHSDTQFGSKDHRAFNREGRHFDKGETFSGIEYGQGLNAVEKLKVLFPDFDNLAPVALKWILMNPHISCIIPGASRPDQVVSNVSSINLPDISESTMDDIAAIYNSDIKESVHHLW